MPIWYWGNGQTFGDALVTAEPRLRARHTDAPWTETRWVVDGPPVAAPTRSAQGTLLPADWTETYRLMIPGECWERVSAVVYPPGSSAWYSKLGNAPGQKLAFDEVTDYSPYATAAWLDMPWRWAANGTRVIVAFGIFPPPVGSVERVNLTRILAEISRYPQGMVFCEAYPLGWRGPDVGAIRGPELDWLGLLGAAGLVWRSVYGICPSRRTDLALRDGRPELSAFEPYPDAVRRAIYEGMRDWSARGCEHVGLWGSGYDVQNEGTRWALDEAIPGLLAGRALR